MLNWRSSWSVWVTFSSVKDWHWKTFVKTAFLKCATDLDVLLRYFYHLGKILGGSELILVQDSWTEKYISTLKFVINCVLQIQIAYIIKVSGQLKYGKANEVKLLEKEETWWHFDKMSPDFSVWSETRFAFWVLCSGAVRSKVGQMGPHSLFRRQNLHQSLERRLVAPPRWLSARHLAAARNVFREVSP